MEIGPGNATKLVRYVTSGSDDDIVGKMTRTILASHELSQN